MSTDAIDSTAWLITKTGKYRHIRRAGVPWLGTECGLGKGRRGRLTELAEAEISSLPVCPGCVKKADERVMWEMDQVLRGCATRLSIAKAWRAVEERIGPPLPQVPQPGGWQWRCDGTWQQHTSPEQRDEIEDALAAVRASILRLADAFEGSR